MRVSQWANLIYPLDQHRSILATAIWRRFFPANRGGWLFGPLGPGRRIALSAPRGRYGPDILRSVDPLRFGRQRASVKSRENNRVVFQPI